MESITKKIQSLLGNGDESNQAITRNVYANDPERNRIYPNNVISNTKYTVFTFLPKNIMEQFGRPMNVYFLMIGILQLFPMITPVDPISTWGALAFIFAISAVKEAYDDINRRRRDHQANNRVYSVLRDGRDQLTEIRSADIAVGDILYLPCDSEIPADLVVLTSSDPEGACYVQTANLDGETDLKTRSALSATSKMSPAELTKFHGIIECPTPSADIYKFDARMSMQTNNTFSQASNQWVNLDTSHLLLQATHLRNTDYIYGIVVYTGNETKVGKNKKLPPTKTTKLDKAINMITVFIFCLQLLLVLIFGAIGESIRRTELSKLWYLGYSEGYKSPWYEFIIIPLRFLLLNSMMIPISLKVTIDVVKYSYALFIGWDQRMYNKSTDSYAVANSTALSEDLGQVEYIFTDKTGTLTENIMLFSKCSIDNQIYGDECSALHDDQLQQQIQNNNPHVLEFFKALSLCHSVLISIQQNGDIHYKASSPDEEALVKAASILDIKFVGKTANSLRIEVKGEEKEYQLLHSFEFNSDRKRMSVVIRDLATKKIKIITKGADDVIFQRLEEDRDYRTSIVHIEEFAAIGLRTLCITEREIKEEEYNHWFTTFYQPASVAIQNRQQHLFDSYNLLECNLRLLGITAIEDKLQDEVPETIYDLRQANIKVWMLTGDKYSTAIQIAHSCHLIGKGCKIFTVGKPLAENDDGKTGADTKLSAREVVDSILEIQDILQSESGSCSNLSNSSNPLSSLNTHHSYDENNDILKRSAKSSGSDITIVIEGHVLTLALAHAESQLLELTKMVSSVICCRVTPNQKAMVVRMVKNTGKICLAIGDGGNDVSMIQEANVGVGISGREGLQAARAADYSIGRFRFLRDLVFIHGRYSYLRTSFVANYSFYKSLFICFIQILYQLFSDFGGTSFFNTFSLTTYNIIFTGLPIMGFILDKDLPESILRRNPFLYVQSQQGGSFNLTTFIRWALRAAFQAIIIFTANAGYYACTDSGSTIDYASFSMISFTGIIILQSFTLFFESHSITWINHILIWGTIPVYLFCVLILNVIPTSDFYSVMTHLGQSNSFWGSLFLMLVACIVPVITIEYILQIQNPTLVQMVNQVRKLSSTHPIQFKSQALNSLTTLQVHSYNNEPKILKFLLYRKLTHPIAKHFARKIEGDKEVIELVVVDEDHDYINQCGSDNIRNSLSVHDKLLQADEEDNLEGSSLLSSNIPDDEIAEESSPLLIQK